MTERAFEYHHVVGFEETNLVGNVYYVNYVRWQGRCRELFLRAHAPDVLDALSDDLALVTVRVSCDFLAELRAFDTVTLRMRLTDLTHNRMTLGFDYVCSALTSGDASEPDARPVARGEQVVASMRRRGDAVVPTPVPASLREALALYAPALATGAAAP